jgi:hypothetical protein
VYHPSFFSEVSVCDVFLWLGFPCSDFYQTATTAPSLRALDPSSSLIRFQSIQVYKHQPFSFLFPVNGGGRNYPEWPVLPYFRLLHHVQPLFPLQRGWRLHKGQFLIVCNPTEDLSIHFAISNPVVSCRSWWIPSCFVAAVSGLCFLSHTIITVSAYASFWTSIFLKFPVPCCPWSHFSRWRFPFDVPLLHSESSSCWWQPISTRIHYSSFQLSHHNIYIYIYIA